MHIHGNGGLVGRVVGLWRYPVKSMRGEALNEVNVSWHGLAGDRRWAFVRDGVAQSGFPWLTLRERADMNHYLPSFVDPTQPDKSSTLVRTPGGVTFDVTDPTLAAELWPDGARVIKHDRGVFDTFPLSLITRQTIEALAGMVSTPLDVQRFRPNLLIDAASDAPFAEDEWVGRILRIGDLRMRVDKRDGRCAVITIDPATSQKEPSVLRAVVRQRQGCAGVYGSTVAPGRIALDDDVLIIE
ncbi:MOSC domain-containing protein [Peristeroidobacter agariperforans]|uniref:MOSC domain-containing protein n=1 Tax=Peristeroidobacter agariperforans TaxID=268404 RepID=UPI00101B7B33|nr:MOSC N-terminal beta barrel domain-containing protein [Peristeroidobacter agariperforans]